MLNIKVNISEEELYDKIYRLPQDEKLDFIKNALWQESDFNLTINLFKLLSYEILQYFEDNSFEQAALRTILLTMEG